jgi:amidase
MCPVRPWHGGGVTHDPFNALVYELDVPGAPGGALAGTTFVAKDVFDIAGAPTGAGSVYRRRTAAPATGTASAIERLLAGGSRLVGRARSEEMAYGMSGRNELDGTPMNPAAPGRLTGGSSSGSAAAVAGGLADIGLGTDTAGSIRVPASQCGLFGLRPTHGRVPADHLVPLAPSFDTVGWLTRTGSLAWSVGAVLLDGFVPEPPPLTAAVVLDDVVDAASPAVAAAHRIGTESLPTVDIHHARLGDLDRWREALRVLQGREVWQVHGAWLRENDPPLGAAVQARFEMASRVTAEEAAAAEHDRDELRRRVFALLDAQTALVVPASGVVAIPLDADADEIDAARRITLALTCIASLLGLPSLAVPIAGLPLPVGLALIGPPGADESLLLFGQQSASVAGF